ncbi:MAG: SixA phosphatase family protein [Acidimicrobiia bacterium]
MTTLFVVRHARAGRRDEWDGADEDRPLSKAGRRQAKKLSARLKDEPITRIVSSPYVRCVQSVEPLAEQLRRSVEESDGLAEGAPAEDVRDLLDKCGREVTVLCTHGDVIELILDDVRSHGVKLKKPVHYGKGSVWEFVVDDGSITGAKYHPAP